jgi:hypothetical protein
MNQFKMLMILEDCKKNPQKAKDELIRGMFAQTGFRADPKSSTADLLAQFKTFMINQGRQAEYEQNFAHIQEFLEAKRGQLKASDVLEFMLKMPTGVSMTEEERDMLEYAVRRNEGD